MTSNEQTIRAFIEAWSRLDIDELVSYFAPDGSYHNMPAKPVQGHAALQVFIGQFLKGWTSTEWDILTLMSSGNKVVAERLDRTMLGEKPVNLPCCGVFEMEEGKIKVWRDYFDMQTYIKAVSA